VRQTAVRPAAQRPGRVLIAGASLGGLRAAEQLRAAGWGGAILVVGDEPHLPYNRPPLSKEALADGVSFDAVALRRKAATAEVEWRLGVRVEHADLAGRTAALSDGTGAGWDGLVVATGMRARRLDLPGPAAGPGSGRHAIRTLDDATALRAELTPSARVVIVGAGFIGCEVAATARRLGCEVTLVEPQPLPMLRPLGELLARALLEQHTRRGVRFALGRWPVRLHGRERVTGVELDDGTLLPADVLVEAVGSLANTEWLTGNGLDLSDGVLCDSALRVQGLPRVVAVGDVARFPNPRYDEVARRVEHWCIPTDTARHAARTLASALAGQPPRVRPFAPLPSFWSDQYELRLQSFGAPALADEIRLLEGPGPGPDLVAGYYRRRSLVGVVALGVGATAAAARYRPQLEALAPGAVG
jgi:3-phenylpropionate/trans-cinnamate dioxygenase ferredoxin reductase subunit